MESVVQQKDQALGQMDREMEELRAELARVKSANATVSPRPPWPASCPLTLAESSLQLTEQLSSL